MFYQSPFAGSYASELIHSDNTNSSNNSRIANTDYCGSKITENFFS